MSTLNIVRKREILARGLFWSGAASIFSHLPARDSLLVLAYHRIGNPDDDLFDPGVFSATADQFDDQISYLKRRLAPVTLEEALAFIDGSSKEKSRHCRVLITFDDGYRDNFDVAFPILRSHGVQGVFFLASGMVGSTHISWWDEIAYRMRTARNRRFTLHYPAGLNIDLDRDGFRESLRAVLRLYKTPANSDSARFLCELAEAAKGEDPPGTQRRFVDWGEAREMIGCGMAIGSHSHSHTVLSQLGTERQCEELMKSKMMLEENLGIALDVLAYPVGGRGSFTAATQRIAREAGYRAAFSFHGGSNERGKISPFDVKRNYVGSQSQNRFHVQTAVYGFTGHYWP